MRKNFKRIAGIVLSIIMLTGAMAGTAFAADILGSGVIVGGIRPGTGGIRRPGLPKGKTVVYEVYADIREPEVGMTPQYVADPTDNEEFTPTVAEWYEVSTLTDLSNLDNFIRYVKPNEKFQRGKKYAAEVLFEVTDADEYEFADASTVRTTINGTSVSNISGDGSKLRARIGFNLDKAPESKVITEVSVNGVSIPTLGGTFSRSHSVYSTENYELPDGVEWAWIVLPDNRALGKDEVLEAGKRYMLLHFFKAKPGYSFANSVDAKIFGMSDSDYRVNNAYMTNGYLRVEYDFGVIVDDKPEAPVITSQPKDANIKNGQDATFKVEAKGKDLKYKWYMVTKDGIGVEFADGGFFYKGINTDELKVLSYKTALPGSNEYDCAPTNVRGFYCEVSNAGGTVKTREAAYSVAHEAEGGWKSDSTNHWKTCGCGEVLDKAKHTMKDNKCSVCGYTVKAESYDIIINKPENGTVYPDSYVAEKGEKVILSVTPKDGYALESISAVDKNNKKVDITKDSEKRYTFIMPASNVEVTAKFVKTGTTPVTPGTPGTPAKKVIQMQIGNKVIKVDGKDFVNDVAPVILNDRTMVPIRVITESLGGTVDWDASTKTVILHIDGKDIIMIIGMEITGYGVAPSILNDRTYVPIRVVADKLGAQTTWIAETKQVVIEK